jgi:diacylglycerol kinase family enzyme
MLPKICKWQTQKIDVITAVTATAASVSTQSNDHSKEVTARIFLNAAEMGVGAEIIYRSKKIRDKLRAA